MPKRVEDIIPGKRRTIRDIPVDREEKSLREDSPTPKRKLSDDLRSEKRETRKTRETLIPKTEPAQTEVRPKPRKRAWKKWPLVVIGLLLIIAIAGFIGSTYFSQATFTIVPKTVPVDINSTYVADGTPKGSLTYALITVRGTASTTVPAADGPYLSSKAEGKITVYNYYSTKSQRLIAGTRFSDSNGRVYRLTSSVVVPGALGSSTPGKLLTSVAADQPGQSYNISKTENIGDLKIVAYKGTSKYEHIYGKVSTDIAGGFAGTKKTVNPTTVASTTAILKKQLTDSLLKQVKGAVPAGYVMYDDAYVTNFGSPVIGGSKENQASISVGGTVYGMIFNTKELAAKVAGDKANVFNGLSYNAEGLQGMSFSLANAKDFAPDKKSTLIFRLKGNVKLVGDIPVEEIKKKLAGASLARTQEILRPYNSIIESGSGELVPPWSKVPSSPDRIKIVVEKP